MNLSLTAHALTSDEQIEDDLETMRGGFNLCVGQLREDELEAFNRLCAAGHARRVYRGAMGFLGLAIAERDYPYHGDFE